MPKIYLVGGAVRDKILGFESKDLDFVIETSDYNEAREVILSLGCKIVQERPEYNVFRAIHPILGGVDFALPRTDFNQDGRQAHTKIVNTIEEDLSRRDFTMNAIACEVKFELDMTFSLGKMIDPFGGKNHIEKKIIKFVGEAETRIKEDELRILRALRFAITKNFSIDVLDALVITFSSRISKKVSNERIFEELNKMFAVSNTKTIDLLNATGQTYILDRVKLKATT